MGIRAYSGQMEYQLKLSSCKFKRSNLHLQFHFKEHLLPKNKLVHIHLCSTVLIYYFSVHIVSYYYYYYSVMKVTGVEDDISPTMVAHCDVQQLAEYGQVTVQQTLSAISKLLLQLFHTKHWTGTDVRQDSSYQIKAVNSFFQFENANHRMITV